MRKAAAPPTPSAAGTSRALRVVPVAAVRNNASDTATPASLQVLAQIRKGTVDASVAALVLGVAGPALAVEDTVATSMEAAEASEAVVVSMYETSTAPAFSYFEAPPISSAEEPVLLVAAASPTTSDYAEDQSEPVVVEKLSAPRSAAFVTIPPEMVLSPYDAAEDEAGAELKSSPSGAPEASGYQTAAVDEGAVNDAPAELDALAVLAASSTNDMSPAVGPASTELSTEAPAESGSGTVAAALTDKEEPVAAPDNAPPTPAAMVASAAQLEPTQVAAAETIAAEAPAPTSATAPAPAAVAATVAVPLPLPASQLPDLVNALVANEQFIAALVNNEAFLDRLAGDDSVIEELARRKTSSVAILARRELASELIRRQALLDQLKERGSDAVMAVADAARAATDAIDSAGSGKATLMGLETAMELLEDTEELMMAVEGKPMDAEVEFSGDSRYRAMEGFVAATEARLERKMDQLQQPDDENAQAATPANKRALMKAEREVQAAVKELFVAAAEDAEIEEAAQAVEAAAPEAVAAAPAPAATNSRPASMVAAAAARSGVEEVQKMAAAAVADVSDDPTIGGAYDHLVMAMAELQRAYGRAVGTAVLNAEKKLVDVEQAAEVGVGKTRELVAAKTQELEEDIEVASRTIAAVAPSGEEVTRDALVLEVGALSFLLYRAYRALVNATNK